jgi:hypothetical protein
VLGVRCRVLGARASCRKSDPERSGCAAFGGLSTHQSNTFSRESFENKAKSKNQSD